MRKLLEGQAAYWATERATPEEIAELESILKQEGLSLKDIHTRFHNGVTALSKNPILIHMLAEFQEQFKKQRELNFVILPMKIALNTGSARSHQIRLSSQSPPRHASAHRLHLEEAPASFPRKERPRQNVT
ncbi:MAG: FCD domain-containing protein [Bilophila wadsworthia]